MAKNKSNKQVSDEQKKKEGKRALIIFILATGFFIFSIVNYFRVEG